MDRFPGGDDYRHPLNLDWKSGHSWDVCGHIIWGFLWYKDCLFRVGVSLVVGMTGGVQKIANCKNFVMYSTVLVVVSQ